MVEESGFAQDRRIKSDRYSKKKLRLNGGGRIFDEIL
jgi:hypothetical protein